MPEKFPSPEWYSTLFEKLNTDTRYREIARNWEGDLAFIIEPFGPITEPFYFYLDLWHGTCRKAHELQGPKDVKAAFVLTASYENIARILTGTLDPMQALMTRKLKVQGNMAVMMRSVPTVLDFVRCAREITSEVL